MSSIFNNSKITHLVTFDMCLSVYEIDSIPNLQNIILFGKIPTIKNESINPNVYDKEYVEKTPKTLNFRLNFSEFTLIDNYPLKNEINIIICFDQSGINSVRFEFDIISSINTPDLIKIVDKTADWVDSCLFCILKTSIMNLFPISKKNPYLLKVHSTYSIVSSTDTKIKELLIEKEIFGIIWNIKKNYKLVHANILAKVIENSLPVYKNDIFTIAEPGALMIFQRKKAGYVNERINAIELHQRQNLLLKKLDFKLDNIISKVGEKEKINLNSAIKEIENTQIEIQSALEIYRNTRISATSSFVMLFDILNNVFRLDKQYNFIQEKLNACGKIYDGLHAEQRNILMERIEWIVVILGVESLILLLLVEVICGSITIQLKIGIIVAIFVSFLIIVGLIALAKNYKKIPMVLY